MTGGADAHQGLLVSGRFSGARGRALRARRSSSSATTPLAPLTVVVGSAAVRTRVGDLLVRRLGAVANVSVVTLGAAGRRSRRRGARGAAGRARGPRPRAPRAAPRRRARGRARVLRPVVDRPHFAQALAATFADLREACVPPDSRVGDAVARPRSPAVRRRAAPRPRDLGPPLPRLLRRARGAAAARRRRRAAGGGRRGRQRAPLPRRGHPLRHLRPQPGAGGARPGAHRRGRRRVRARAARRPRGRRARARRGARARARRSSAGSTPPAGRATASGVRCRLARRTPRGEPLVLGGDGSLAVVSVVGRARRDARGGARRPRRRRGRRVRLGLRGGRAARRRRRARRRRAARGRAAGRRAACRTGPPGRACCCVWPTVWRRRPASRSRGARSSTCFAAAPLRAGGRGGRDGPVARRGPAGRRGGRARAVDERLASRRRGPGAAAGRPRGEGRRRRRGRRRRGRRQGRRGAAPAWRPCAAWRPPPARSCGACGGRRTRASWGEWAEFFAAAVGGGVRAQAADEARDAAVPPAGARRARRGGRPGRGRGACCASCSPARACRAGRVGRDGVAVLTPLELRGLSFHTVVFTGLAEGGFPARGRPDPLLGDAERRRVGAALGVRLPLAEQRDAESLLLFAFACEAARERLVLLAPRTERRRRAAAAAVAAPAAARVAGRRPAGRARRVPRAASRSRPVWRRARRRRPAFARRRRVGRRARARHRRCCSRSSAAGVARPPRAYLAAVLGDDGAAGAALRRLALGAQPRAGRLGRPARRRGPRRARGAAPLRRRDASHAPRALRRAARSPSCCATCSGWRRRTSRATRSRWTPREFGTLAHDILQRAYEQVIDGDLRRDGRAGGRRRGLGGRAAPRPRAAASPARRSRGRCVASCCSRTCSRPCAATPCSPTRRAARWASSGASARPRTGRSSLELAGGRAVRFAGRLDRVDETPSGARVIDYKTGRRRHRAQPPQGPAQRAAARLPARRAAGRRRATTRPSPASTGWSRAAAASRTSTCRRTRQASDAAAARRWSPARSRWSTPACSRAPRASAASTATSATPAACPAGRGRASASTSCSPTSSRLQRRPPRRTR